MTRVFLSYQWKDKVLARSIEAALTRRGLLVWWDEHSNPADDWPEEVEREIDASDYVLVLWTANSVKSGPVKAEAMKAIEFEPSKLRQARLDKCSLPLLFKTKPYAELDRGQPERSRDWAKLMRWLGIPEEENRAAPPPTSVKPRSTTKSRLDFMISPPAPPIRDRPLRASQSDQIRETSQNLPAGAINSLRVLGILVAVGILAWVIAQVSPTPFLAAYPWALFILLGLGAGAVAKLIMPGPDAGGCLMTLLLGIGGAVLAGFLGQQLGWYTRGEGAGFIAAIVGAVLILFVYRLVVNARR